VTWVEEFNRIMTEGGTIAEADAINGHVGAGWQPILAELHERLTTTDPGYRCAQVKEKFGALRVYFVGVLSDAGDEAVRDAEVRSAVTCERCGAPGTRRHGGWILTLCDACDNLRRSP
jgi:hypothetical protein